MLRRDISEFLGGHETQTYCVDRTYNFLILYLIGNNIATGFEGLIISYVN